MPALGVEADVGSLKYQMSQMLARSTKGGSASWAADPPK
jgi:hypothetical protein